MASKKKSKKKSSRPSVPEAQAVPALSEPSEMARPEYEPMSLNDFQAWMNTAYDLQLARAPQVLGTQLEAQKQLYTQGSQLARAQAYENASAENQMLQAYAPEFRQTYGALGGRINEGLASGYDLGPGLQRELEQSIRGAQTARGNILGAAPTAQEAFGKGQAALQLYNQRLGQAQGYLQGNNPIGQMGQIGAATGIGSAYYPSQSYVDSGLGASAMASAGQQAQAFNSTVQSGYSSFQNALQNYNQNQISGTSVTNEGIFNQYDRAADYWQYDEAVRRGLYSTPQVGGGGGGMGGMMGGMGGAMGAVGTGMMGLAASGVIGTGATAAGVGIAGAAAGAAAAICWLARRCLPSRWEEFQHYLFTDAPEKLRRLYIYNARRLAREITDDEATKIGQIMYDCINLRTQS